MEKRIGAQTKANIIVHGGGRYTSYRLYTLERRLLVYYVHFYRLVCSLCLLLLFANLLRLSAINANLNACLTYFVVAVCMSLGAGQILVSHREFRSFSFDARGVLSITAVFILICTLVFLYPHHVRPYLQHSQFSNCSSRSIGPDLIVTIASDVSNQRRASVPE